MARPARSSSNSSGQVRAGSHWAGPYWERSQRPLEILVLLLPFVAVYEAGLLLAARPDGGIPVTNLAHRYIHDLFSIFGVTGLGTMLPGLLLVVVLVAWQFLSKRSWSVHWGTVGLMWAESLLLVLPLLVFARLLVGGGIELQVADANPDGLFDRVAMGVGAGLYEELVFRWALIAIVHGVLVDGFKRSHRTTVFLAVVLSSVAFMLYHPIQTAEGRLLPGLALFYLGSGAYFSVVYLLRGFGVVAATHALYDVAVVLLAQSISN
jgi:hypothetical protein